MANGQANWELDTSNGRTGSSWRRVVWASLVLVLLLPLLLMRFTEEVDWSGGDFVVAGALLGGVGLAFELALRQSSQLTYRVAVGIALFATLLLVWVSLAVGIIGSEGNQANLMYVGVLAAGGVGTWMARLRPSGMARTLLGMALVQLLVTAIAVLGDLGAPGSGARELIVMNAVFVVPFCASSFLFRRAGRT